MTEADNSTTPASVTLAQIEARIAFEESHVFGGVLTVYVVRLANGFMVTGESACADPAKFDPGLGRHYAREDALRKIWAFEGYLLRERLHRERRETQGGGQAG